MVKKSKRRGCAQILVCLSSFLVLILVLDFCFDFQLLVFSKAKMLVLVQIFIILLVLFFIDIINIIVNIILYYFCFLSKVSAKYHCYIVVRIQFVLVLRFQNILFILKIDLYVPWNPLIYFQNYILFFSWNSLLYSLK